MADENGLPRVPVPSVDRASARGEMESLAEVWAAELCAACVASAEGGLPSARAPCADCLRPIPVGGSVRCEACCAARLAAETRERLDALRQIAVMMGMLPDAHAQDIVTRARSIQIGRAVLEPEAAEPSRWRQIGESPWNTQRVERGLEAITRRTRAGRDGIIYELVFQDVPDGEATILEGAIYTTEAVTLADALAEAQLRADRTFKARPAASKD